MEEVLPDATIVIDRFHVARHYRDARRHAAQAGGAAAEERTAQGGGMTTSNTRSGPSASARPIWTTTEQERLDALLAYSPALRQAYTLREQLTTHLRHGALEGGWAAAHPLLAAAGRKERPEVLRCLPQAAGHLAGSDCQLLHQPSDQQLCRRAEQQAQSAQTALLWAAECRAPVPAADA